MNLKTNKYLQMFCENEGLRS